MTEINKAIVVHGNFDDKIVEHSGTKAQWRQISKGLDIFKGCGEVVVRCSDGTLTKVQAE